jgi:diacylglycerol kinase (ATP)
MGSRVGLVVNPTSGRNRGAIIGIQVAEGLVRAGHEVIDLSGLSAVSASAKAVAAIAEGIDVLAVTGGDGMVHLGVNLCAGTGLPLAIVAAGTGNDFARGLGLPLHDPASAVDIITRGLLRRVDAVRNVVPGVGGQWFAGVLGAGFDAVVNERANHWSWPRGQARYNLAMLRELPVFRPIPYVVEVDGVRHDTEAMLVVVGNGASYGGGMRVTPDALLDDGLADVLILHRISIPAFLRVFPQVYRGTHVTHPAVEIVRGRRVRLEAPGIVAYADGERFAPLPLDLEVVPGALTVLT